MSPSASAPAAGGTSRHRARLGEVGLWTLARQWPDEEGAVGEVAAELEELGFRTVWLGGSTGQFAVAKAILAGTRSLHVATGIVQIFMNPAAEVVAAYHEIARTFPGRFLLGLGPGHAHSTEAIGIAYERPYSRLVEYLDDLDAAPEPVPPADRLLAALGPRALRLAGDRTAGAHPYNVTPEHTATARDILGTGPLLAPEHKAFFGSDPSAARAVGRATLAMYLAMPNYRNNLRRLGFDDHDFDGAGSDRLIDQLVAWGSPTAVVRRVREHLEAGADQVVVHVLSEHDRGDLPLAAWRQAASHLLA